MNHAEIGNVALVEGLRRFEKKYNVRLILGRLMGIVGANSCWEEHLSYIKGGFLWNSRYLGSLV
jgi:hypothetical protein